MKLSQFLFSHREPGSMYSVFAPVRVVLALLYSSLSGTGGGVNAILAPNVRRKEYVPVRGHVLYCRWKVRNAIGFLLFLLSHPFHKLCCSSSLLGR